MISRKRSFGVPLGLLMSTSPSCVSSTDASMILAYCNVQSLCPYNRLRRESTGVGRNKIDELIDEDAKMQVYIQAMRCMD